MKRHDIMRSKHHMTEGPHKRHTAARIIAGFATAVGAIIAIQSIPQARRYIRMHRM